jgi:hypothetical protein
MGDGWDIAGLLEVLLVRVDDIEAKALEHKFQS